MDLFAGEHKQPAFGEITPRREVPTLVYGEGRKAITVNESVAIIQFPDDMHPAPPLMPPVTEPAMRAKAAFPQRFRSNSCPTKGRRDCKVAVIAETLPCD